MMLGIVVAFKVLICSLKLLRDMLNPNLYRLGALSRSILDLVGRLKGYLFPQIMKLAPLKGLFLFLSLFCLINHNLSCTI